MDCNLSRVARSQSPSSGLGAQGSGPIRRPIAPHSVATEELTLGSETSVQYTLPESESVQVPMRKWPPLMMHSEERQDSSTTILTPGQTPYVYPTALLGVFFKKSFSGFRRQASYPPYQAWKTVSRVCETRVFCPSLPPYTQLQPEYCSRFSRVWILSSGLLWIIHVSRHRLFDNRCS